MSHRPESAVRRSPAASQNVRVRPRSNASERPGCGSYIAGGVMFLVILSVAVVLLVGGGYLKAR